MTQTIIKFLVSTAAGLEAAADTYRAVTHQQQATRALLTAEQEAVDEAQERKRPIGFHTAVCKKRSPGA